MELLNTILLIYTFIGFLVVGGLLFSRSGKAQLFLAVFVFIFSLDQLYFIYESSNVIRSFPDFYMTTFPFTLLFGPALYFHLRYLHKEFKILHFHTLIHLLPFLILLVFTLFIISIPPVERIKFVGGPNYYTVFKPINYFKVFHLCFYALLMILFIKKNHRGWTAKRKNYCIVLVSIYFLTAILQACFTAAILLSHNFIIYYIIASSLVLFVGYILYFHRDILEKINIKYSKSTLLDQDKKRIHSKIEDYLSNSANFVNHKLNLQTLSHAIDEKKHHISQTISEQYSTSFNDLINERRIQYSKKLLIHPNYAHYKILAIALESGFTNKTTFNRAFLKFNSFTPSEFIKQSKTG